MLDFPDELEEELAKSHDVYKEAAVVSNSEYCSSVGCDILKQGGSAVDAAIATMLCESLYAMQNMGPGGGNLMCIYKRDEKRAYCLDAREVAPVRAHKDMFQGNQEHSSSGMLSVGVPGELMGYWEAHKKMGKLPWKYLFQPAITLCQRGVPVNHRLAKAFAALSSEILNSPTLRDVLAPGGRLPKEGDKLRMPALAKTLDIIASSPRGAIELYNGSLTQPFISDIQKYGGIITVQDMASYKVRWMTPIVCPLKGGDVVLHTVPPSGSGPVLSVILQLLDGALPASTPVKSYHHIAEAFKYAYALRTELGDPAFTDISQVMKKSNSSEFISNLRSKILTSNKTSSDPISYGGKYTTSLDFGTINISVLASNGDSVTATSTINTLFGGLVASPSTGIILNNEMDDFCSPRIVNSFGLTPSPANMIEPGKRPLSSMCPSVFTDAEGNVILVIGAAGGTHITTSVAQVAFRNIWLGQTVGEAIEAPRMHHQLQPMYLRYEKGFSTVI